ncbi:MAG: DNA replication and repair protein RecF [Candidatus Shapirobacteria bacterium]|nr:DNA replication and repair protein RecF [Candidatus Shapirobacteria bacterium]
MYLSKLLLQNFRSYQNQLFEFDPKLNLILGPNGSGKTNILEAVFFLSSGKSFRSSSQSKLINWSSYFSSVRAKIIDNQKDTTEIEVRISKDPKLSTSSISRKFLIEKVVKTRKKYLGIIKNVVFQPEDIRLITGSPTRRRDFLDEIFFQTEWRYSSALSQYNRGLKHRNELLDQIKQNLASPNDLFYWDQVLIKNSKIIHDFRIAFVKSVNTFFSNHNDSQINTISINYRPSILNEDKLKNNYQIDLNRGYTQIGPHRDDFSLDNSIFGATDKNLAFWGSRGQQRLAVLALRLAQINFLEETYHDKPILLLDDIFSELDLEHQQLVVKVCQKYQTIFTSSEPDSINILGNAKIIQL